MCIEHIHPIGKIIIGKNKNYLPSEVQESIYEETMNRLSGKSILQMALTIHCQSIMVIQKVLKFFYIVIIIIFSLSF